MGTNNLKSESPGNVANTEDVNQFRDALIGDLVPRGTTGEPENEAGGLGLSDTRWLEAFLKSLTIGDSTDNLTLEVDGTQLVIKEGSTEIQRLGLTGSTSDGSDPGAGGLSSKDVSGSTSSTSYVSVDSITLTTLGRPVEISLSPKQYKVIGAGEASILLESGAIGTLSGFLKVQRGGSDIHDPVEIGWDSHDNNIAQDRPPGMFRVIDTPAAGTHTYELFIRVSNAAGTLSVNHSRMIAREL